MSGGLEKLYFPECPPQLRAKILKSVYVMEEGLALACPLPGPEHPEEHSPNHGEEVAGVVGPRLLALRVGLVIQHPAAHQHTGISKYSEQSS